MDSLWLDGGLDLKMRQYRIQPIKVQTGLIEFVQGTRIKDIQQDTQQNTKKSFQKRTINYFKRIKRMVTNIEENNRAIFDYLQEYNLLQDDFELATDNFMRSCAGYLVATYILGIWDRSRTNTLISQSGHLNFVNFTHFLGNKRNYSSGQMSKRQRFWFNSQYAAVMGEQDGEKF